MRKTLLATSALALAGALAAGPASAADMLSVGVGGYMQQWFGVADRDDMDADGGAAAQSDSEIHVKGSLESDMGLKFSVHMELEGDRGSNAIDESYARVSGEFGQLEIGARDHAMVRMHSGISDVGVGLNAGDTQKWIPGAYLETSGHGIGNARKLNYISPRVSGLQVGVSYAPDDTTQAAASAPTGNDKDGWGVAMNFQQEVGDMAVTISAGHKTASTVGMAMGYMSGSEEASSLSKDEYEGHMEAIEEYAEVALAMGSGNLQGLRDDAAAAVEAIDEATDMSATKSDASTYTNFGIGVGMGAFGFNVAYAMAEGGAYMLQTHYVDPNAGTVSATDDEGDDIVTQRVVKDSSKDYDVWGVSVSYADGPMALSLGHMAHETDAGGQRDATMLSGSYTLAPGVAWKTSLMMVEDTTVDDGLNEGTAIVTGITLGF